MKQKKIVNTGERLYKLFIYLVLGILNLVAYAARNHRKQKQSAKEAAKQAETASAE